MRTLVFSLMVLALLHAFKPYFTDSTAAMPRDRVEEFARQAKSITPDKVAQHIVESQKPTMLVIFASWCGYCKKVMPSIFQLWNEKKIPGDQLLIVSVDRQVAPLADYLLSSRFDAWINAPLILDRTSRATLGEKLQPLGAHFDGGIPYIGFFNASGTLMYEIRGFASKNEIENALVKLK